MDPIRDSLDNPIVLVIRTSRAASWPQAQAILDTLPEDAPFDDSLKAYYFVVKPNRESFAKAMALVDLLGHTKGLQIFINGGVRKASWNLARIGECFLKAAKFDDNRKYCHVIHEYEELRRQNNAIFIQVRLPDSEMSAEEVEDKSRVIRRAVVPCRYLYEQVGHKFRDRNLDAVGLTVIAVDSGVDVCPFFNASSFAEIFPKMIGSHGEVEEG